MAATSIALPQSEMPLAHELRGRVGMWCLIAAESAIFSIFVVAYLYYAGKSLSGPTPSEVLHVPIFNSICLFSSSFTIVMAERAIARGQGQAVRDLVAASPLCWGRFSSWAPRASGIG